MFLCVFFLCFCVFVFLCFCVFVFLCFCVFVFLCFCVFVFLCFCVFVFLCHCVPMYPCFYVSMLLSAFLRFCAPTSIAFCVGVRLSLFHVASTSAAPLRSLQGALRLPSQRLQAQLPAHPRAAERILAPQMDSLDQICAKSLENLPECTFSHRFHCNFQQILIRPLTRDNT